VRDVGKPDFDLVAADPGDLGLGTAEGVDALTDDLDRAIHVLRGDVLHLGRRPALVDELGPTLEVEPQHGRLLGDHVDRDAQQEDHEAEDDQAVTTLAHWGPYCGVSTSSSPPSSS